MTQAKKLIEAIKVYWTQINHFVIEKDFHKTTTKSIELITRGK